MIFFWVDLEEQLRFIARKVNLDQLDQNKGYLIGLGMGVGKRANSGGSWEPSSQKLSELAEIIG